MAERKVTLNEQKIRSLVTTIYDIQKLRIAVGNRIVASFNAQMDVAEHTEKKEDPEDVSKEDMKFLLKLTQEFKQVTTAYVEAQMGIKAYIRKHAPELSYIKSESDYKLIQHYQELVSTEQGMVKLLTKEVTNHPMWDLFFKDVIGCGPMIAGIIISYFDAHTARHPSSFWKYAGLDVVDGKGRNRSMLVEKTYTKREGTEITTMGLSYNPFVKTKLIGVLASGFLKKPGCHYEQVYRNYRARLEQRTDLGDSVARKHQMSLRYAVKMFLRDLWVVWREYEGYDVGIPEYEVAFLGKQPHGYNEAV